MAYTLQLIDAKNSTIKNVAGVCVDSSAFTDLINEAQRRLMNRGNFWGLEKVCHFSITNCRVVWPRFVGTVLGARFCNRSPSRIFNQWFTFTDPAAAFSSWTSDAVLVDDGTAPCFNEISGTTGKILRYYVTKTNDIGKTITLYGRKYGAQPLQELDTDGVTWVNGLTITAAAPFAATTTYVTKIDSVVREATEGRAFLYEVDATTGDLRDLAIYEPNETNPRYRVSRIQNMPAGYLNDNDECRYELEVLFKLEFIPVVQDRDFLMIDNLDALKLMVQAIKAEESNDDTLAETKLLKAVRELNLQDRNKHPSEQTPVSVRAVIGGKITNPL